MNLPLKIWRHFLSDSLFRNSAYLMTTTVVMGGLGFFYWIICTRLFTPEEIGLGTTILSAMSLISLISLLGINTAFIRFLPNSKNRNADINTGVIFVAATAIALSILYVILIPYITPRLGIVHQSFWYAAGFIAITAVSSINSLTDSVFIAYRSAQYSLITNGFVISLSKMILPFALVGFGAYAVFAATGIATAAGMLASGVILFARFGYRPQSAVSKSAVDKAFGYSFFSYFVNLISLVPTFIVPFIIITYLGAAEAGYYYIAFMLINSLYAVSNSVSQSLFAEGSYAEARLRDLMKRSFIILGGIMTPAAIVAATCGPLVLSVFGNSYSAGASGAIIILSIAAPAVAAHNIANVLLRIRHQMYSLAIVHIIYAAVICGLTALWAPYGLAWVAGAWTISNLIAALISFAMIFAYRGLPTPSGVA